MNRSPTHARLSDLFSGTVARPGLWLLWLGLQVPSLRALFKYVPPRYHVLIPVYLLATWLVCFFLLHPNRLPARLVNALHSVWLTVGLLMLVTVVSAVVYPIADALKFQMRGSDQDDALILVGTRLLAGQSPYAATTYFGNPLSPGPGMVLLAFPFLGPHRYFLMTPCCLALGALAIMRTLGRAWHANTFLLLCLSSLAFWECTVVGSDLPAIGCLVVLCALLCSRLVGTPRFWILGLPMLVLLATARVVFLYWVPLFALFVWKRNRRAALTTLLGGLFGALLLHAFFYLWDPSHYAPLHLIPKGRSLIRGLLLPVFLLSVLLASWLLVRQLTAELRSWLHALWLALAVPLALVALADLVTVRNLHFVTWEGANYLMVPLPLLALLGICPSEVHGRSSDRIAGAGLRELS